MTVYVDDMRRRARVGRITANWSHLMADTSDELRAFAQALGLNPEWIQHAGTHREHFDLTDGVRARALAIGAQPMSYPRQTGQYMAERRAAAKAAWRNPMGMRSRPYAGGGDATNFGGAA